MLNVPKILSNVFFFFKKVTFNIPSEAAMAMKSAEAVMGNRFIKVFYHSEAKMVPPVKDRIGGKPSVSFKLKINNSGLQLTTDKSFFRLFK